jgi:formylglycine-generating enzyme required for sulfatase activity/CheY-like chemotaxis protein
MRILLVDDDTSVIQALLPALKGLAGVEVRVATTGAKALENAAALGGLDLLITDVVMEPMNGFALREEIIARYPEVRTILISGYDLSDYAEQTRDLRLLAKPLDHATLLGAIEQEFAPPPEPEPEPMPVPAPVARPVAVARAVASAMPAPKSVAAQPKATAVPQTTVVASATSHATAVPKATATAAAVPKAVAAAPKAMAAVPRAVAAVSAAPVARAISAETLEENAPVAPEESDSPAVEILEAYETPATGEADPLDPLAAQQYPASSSGESLLGQTIGAYQILSHLGGGRWGSVYAAVQVSINRPVGLKVLDTTYANDSAVRDRFIADARAKAHVQHPSTLAVYEAGQFENYIFYAQEFVDGQSMAEIRDRAQKLDETQAMKVMRVVAEGLAYLTIHRLPHSSLLATNIFLGVDGGPRLANLATQLPDNQFSVEEEIQALGAIMLEVLPPFDALSPGLGQLLSRMTQPGPDAVTGWGQLLQGLKALEPKVIPVEAAKISAQDRAAIAAVEQARKHQKRSLYINIGSVLSLILVGGFVAWKVWGTNERTLDDQVHIPAGEFLFANGEPTTLPEFWIDKYEVTYGQYAKFVQFLDANPTSEYDDKRQTPRKTAEMHKPEHWEIFYGQAKANGRAHGVPIDLNCPVMEVDWWDAYAYAKWKGRELPTEQEWEKAARGTKGFAYPWGDELDPKKVNSNADFNPNNPGAKGMVDGFNFWNPVDAIKGDKSPFGVVGMAGNVREWTGTWDASKKHPIIKGGSYMSTDVHLDQRTDNFEPSYFNESLGFRTISHTPPAKK